MGKVNTLIFEEVESKFENVITNLIQNCQVKCAEIQDMYVPEARGKYIDIAISETVAKIEEVKADYVAKCKTALDAEKYKANAQKPTKTSAEKLSDNMQQLIDMQILNMKLNTMSMPDIIKLGQNTESELEVLQCKNKLFEIASTQGVEESLATRTQALALHGQTDSYKLAQLEEKLFNIENNNSIYPALRPGHNVLIHSEGGLNNFLHKIVESNTSLSNTEEVE